MEFKIVNGYWCIDDTQIKNSNYAKKCLFDLFIRINRIEQPIEKVLPSVILLPQTFEVENPLTKMVKRVPNPIRGAKNVIEVITVEPFPDISKMIFVKK